MRFPSPRMRGEGQGEGRPLPPTTVFAAAPHPDLLVAPKVRASSATKDGEKEK